MKKTLVLTVTFAMIFALVGCTTNVQDPVELGDTTVDFTDDQGVKIDENGNVVEESTEEVVEEDKTEEVTEGEAVEADTVVEEVEEPTDAVVEEATDETTPAVEETTAGTETETEADTEAVTE